jgi:acetyl-CoA carboxylase biotin carboxylase subunit
VREQIRIAAGEKLGYTQDEVVFDGHAIECRINAEDPDANFMPSPGKILGLRAPGGPWVRDDSGVYEGYTVPRYYDTLMAKLIVWAPDREGAIARMDRALAEYHVSGVRTTLPVLRRIIRHPDFAAGRIDTGFMERLSGRHPSDSRRSIALIAAVLEAYERAGRQSNPPPSQGVSPWTRGGRPGSSNWRAR